MNIFDEIEKGKAMIGNRRKIGDIEKPNQRIQKQFKID